MKSQTSLDLTHNLFQIMKQIPHIKLIQKRGEGLRRREYDLLLMLAMNLNADTPALTVTELGNLLQITPAGVTHLLNPLEDSGCIERLPDPQDRRVVLIGLTEKGRAIADDLIQEVQNKLTGLMDYLGEEDGQILIRLLSKMMEFFSAQQEAP